jgi:hypothetical protein
MCIAVAQACCVAHTHTNVAIEVEGKCWYYALSCLAVGCGRGLVMKRPSMSGSDCLVPTVVVHSRCGL